MSPIAQSIGINELCQPFFYLYIPESERLTWEQSDGLCLEPTTPDPSSILCLEKIFGDHPAVWNNNKMSWGWRKFFPMMIASVNVDQIPNVLSTLCCTSSCSSTSKAVSYSVEAYIWIICPNPDVNYSGFNGLMWLQLQQMARLIFLGSFRLNSNHNYFPIAVVAQTLGILGCSTPIIKEKALFFKTDIRNSWFYFVFLSLPSPELITFSWSNSGNKIVILSWNWDECPLQNRCKCKLWIGQHHQSEVVFKYNRTVPVADGSPAGDYCGGWPVTDNNCM